MNPQDAVDMGREAIWSGLLIVAPILLIGLLLAIAIGIVQSMFQIHEQSIAVIPKLILMTIVLILCLPWISEKMMDYSRDQFQQPQLLSVQQGGR